MCGAIGFVYVCGIYYGIGVCVAFTIGFVCLVFTKALVCVTFTTGLVCLAITMGLVCVVFTMDWCVWHLVFVLYLLLDLQCILQLRNLYFSTCRLGKAFTIFLIIYTFYLIYFISMPNILYVSVIRLYVDNNYM